MSLGTEFRGGWRKINARNGPSFPPILVNYDTTYSQNNKFGHAATPLPICRWQMHRGCGLTLFGTAEQNKFGELRRSVILDGCWDEIKRNLTRRPPSNAPLRLHHAQLHIAICLSHRCGGAPTYRLPIARDLHSAVIRTMKSNLRRWSWASPKTTIETTFFPTKLIGTSMSASSASISISPFLVARYEPLSRAHVNYHRSILPFRNRVR